MSLSKFPFLISLCVCLFILNKGFSQKDSTKKWLKISIDAGLIVNRTFSHLKTPNASGHFADKAITKTKGAPKFLPGFSLGISSVWGHTKWAQFVFGISASITQAKYHYYDRAFESGQGYSGKTQTTDIDISCQYIKLNQEMGYRFPVLKNFFIQQSFILNYNIQTIQKENGIITNTESASAINPAGGWTTLYYNKTESAVHSTKPIPDHSFSFSAKLSAYYQFKMRKKDYAVFLYRNFTFFKDRYPWWGLGVSLQLN